MTPTLPYRYRFKWRRTKLAVGFVFLACVALSGGLLVCARDGIGWGVGVIGGAVFLLFVLFLATLQTSDLIVSETSMRRMVLGRAHPDMRWEDIERIGVDRVPGQTCHAGPLYVYAIFPKGWKPGLRLMHTIGFTDTDADIADLMLLIDRMAVARDIPVHLVNGCTPRYGSLL